MAIGQRRSRPRPMGLLSPVDPGAREGPKRPFPYSLGDRIAGDLTVIGHLATGRVGHIYQVWSAARWCAYTCKILAPALREKRGARAALRREARVLRRLDHPHIVHYYGEGEHEDLPFLLLEYMEGPSIFGVLESRDQRRLAISDAVRVAMHVGAALYHMHRKGLVHLDIKPANLLLRGAVPVLVDFDVARRMDDSRRPQRALGTAPYMAPEYVRCDPPSPAADIYGLGAVLYEMLTGRWPYEAVYREEEERDGVERDYPQLGDAPPPPPREFNPDIPRSLEELILRSLALRPEDRYATLHPMLMALGEELADPVSLWPAGVETERRRTPRD